MIILASSSPRRRELMQMVGLQFIVSTTNCNEDTTETDPEKLTMEIARRKAKAARHGEDDIVVSADTVVYYDGEIIGKPRDADHARAILKRMAGKTHSVYTGVCIQKNDVEDVFCTKTDVKFFDVSEKLIDIYVASGEFADKAGGYGIQGKGALLVERIDGDYYSVMGLPIARVAHKIKKLSCCTICGY